MQHDAITPAAANNDDGNGGAVRIYHDAATVMCIVFHPEIQSISEWIYSDQSIGQDPSAVHHHLYWMIDEAKRCHCVHIRACSRSSLLLGMYHVGTMSTAPYIHHITVTAHQQE